MKEHSEVILVEIANRFKIKGAIKTVKQLGEGFINDTFVVTTESDADPDYLLQRKNKNVFKDVPGMMSNILKVTNHLKNRIINEGGDPERETLTVIPTSSGALYTLDDQDEFWAMCLWIPDHNAYDVADKPELAYAGGKAIGKFQNMLADFTDDLVDTLPGFHNIRFRFEQWDEVVKRDPVSRLDSVKEEVRWIDDRREDMMKFWKLVETGQIPRRITHNDTKISNVLFDKQDEVLCVIDLDTVLNSIVLNDFGDAIRSYANTGAEDEKDLEKVGLNLDVFTAYSKGYLSTALTFMTEIELDNLAFSAIFITYEQTLRFLMDYIDGDNYYRIKYPEHNLVRAKAQNKLLESLEANFEQMKDVIREEAKR